MPERQITPLKPNSRTLVNETDCGAHYYAFSPVLSSSTYTKASATIVLPPPIPPDGRPGLNVIPSPNVGAAYTRRHAYISLGISNDNDWLAEGIDLGIVNIGTGWHPAYYDTAYTQQEKDQGIVAARRYPECTAPSNATKAAIAVMPISNTQVKLYVQFMNDSGAFVCDKFEKNIDTKPRLRPWGKFYRFASMVQYPDKTPDHLNDTTYMVKGQFTDLKLFKSNGTTEDWGIPTTKIQDAFIMSHPKCQVLTQGNNYETFSIDHWA